MAAYLIFAIALILYVIIRNSHSRKRVQRLLNIKNNVSRLFLSGDNADLFVPLIAEATPSDRAHDYIVKNKDKGYRILMLPYYAGWTEGPGNIKSLVSQRDRWQRVINETTWGYRHMFFNPKYKWMGMMTLPYFLIYEVLGVFVEVISISLVAAGWIMGSLNLRVFLAYFCFMLLSQALISVMSIFAFVRDQKVFRLKYIIYMISLSLIELFWYTWIISFSRLLGMFRSFLRYRGYDQYVREKRIKIS